MSMYRRNVNEAVEDKVQEIHPSYPRKEKREKSMMRSLVFLFVIAAIAATVADFRREPIINEDKSAFVSQAEQVMDAAKADLWLGDMSAEELMQLGNWSTIADYPRSTLEDVAKKLLHTPAVVYDWNALKMEAIDRLWKGWETQTAQTDLNAYLTDAVNALVTNQELPGLKSGFWLAVTTDGSRYILTSAGEQWAICPVEALR